MYFVGNLVYPAGQQTDRTALAKPFLGALGTLVRELETISDEEVLREVFGDFEKFFYFNRGQIVAKIFHSSFYILRGFPNMPLL